jgi:ABC-type antimicrobial peptide transport system permease subunit
MSVQGFDMSLASFIFSSLRHYRGLHALVVAGVAVAVAVLAGALLVGASVRSSLRDLALVRLGATEVVVASTGLFREELALDIEHAPIGAAAPILALTGAVMHEDSRRTAARVQVFGIDDRFLAFHGREPGAPASRDAWISAGLAAELGGAANDGLLLRLAKPTEIPLSTLQGRREDVSERVRLTGRRILDRQTFGEFSLLPAQGPALSIFVPLARLQQDLGLGRTVNALLVRMEGGTGSPTEGGTSSGALQAVQQAVRTAARLEDLGLTVRANGAGTMSILESRAGLIPEALSRQVADSGPPTVGALTYLANAIRAHGREIPYSLITAIDLEAYDSLAGTAVPAAPAIGARPPQSTTTHPPIRLNEWAVDDLGVTVGDRVDVDYFLWSDQDGLRTASAAFTFAGVVPMTGAGGDRTLTPEYPGITDAGDVTSWDPPFPVDLKRVRKKDEDYWDAWRSAPKAFIPLDIGQRLWPSPFGTLSSLRTSRTPITWPRVDTVDVSSAGISVRHARAEALAAADGTTDFGEYFIYFSFFLVVSGLLLAGMFFALGVEQRAKELGLLLAVGFRVADVRRTLLGEAAILAGAGSVIGIAGAIGYAALIMYGLRTWWVGAVGTTALELHVDPRLLVVGAAAALVAAVISLFLSFRRLARRSTRALLNAGLADGLEGGATGATHVAPASVPGVIAVAGLLCAVTLVAVASLGWLNQVAAFFGAGGLLLIAGCAAFAAWLRRATAHSAVRRSLVRFGAAYARWRPTRSVLSAALIAFACFVIVAVGAFRRDPAGTSLARDSGTGGFVLMAESVAPLMHNPNTEAGREDLNLDGYAALDSAQIWRYRLRPGDEASCLTLYQPKNPRLVAPESALLADPRFSFAQSLAETDAERANPWLLLNRTFADGAVATIADQTSLTYVFHLKVGDDFVFTPEGQSPIRLRIVGTLADSVLQSELIIGERDFVRLFPHNEGYRIWMIEAPEPDIPALTTLLEDRLSDYGVDVTDTRARLAAYHQVENTYLSTFQALGALGLLLGTLGLAAVLARNVLERRRELGLLGAIGFTPRHLRTLVASESLVLVVCGVGIGTIAALVAVAPTLAERPSAVPVGNLSLLIGGVVLTGLVASLAAVRLATSARVVEALKNE